MCASIQNLFIDKPNPRFPRPPPQPQLLGSIIKFKIQGIKEDKASMQSSALFFQVLFRSIVE